MGLTNYPNGVSSFGFPVLPITGNSAGGNVFFVESSIGSNTGAADGSISNPFATIAYAIGRCTANNGDTIFVQAGHAETIAAAAGIAASVAGISIIGLGGRTNRPIVTFATSTAATFTITAANVLIKGIQFQNAIDSLVAGIVVSGAGCTIDSCSFSSPTATNDALIWVRNTSATDMVIANCDFHGLNAGPASCIQITAADRSAIVNNRIYGSYSNAAIYGVTTLSAELYIAGNSIIQTVTDAKAIGLVASSTGRIEYNNGTVTSTAGITDANIIGAGNCQLAQNYFSDIAGETGKLIGVVSA